MSVSRDSDVTILFSAKVRFGLVLVGANPSATWSIDIQSEVGKASRIRTMKCVPRTHLFKRFAAACRKKSQINKNSFVSFIVYFTFFPHRTLRAHVHDDFFVTFAREIARKSLHRS